MDKVKLYSGTISEDTATMSIKQYYGATTNTSVKKSKTELLNNKLLEFLKECGVDAKYDGNFLWINGVPVTFCFSSTQLYFYSYSPFNNTALCGGSSYTIVFDSGGKYNFKIRLIGEPTNAFVLLISTGYSSPAFNVNGFVFAFYKAENMFSKRESRVIETISNGYVRVFDLGNDGSPVDIGRSSASASVYDIGTIVQDFKDNPDKYPMKEWWIEFFRVPGCYYQLSNDPLPKSEGASGETQTFIKIGNDIYLRYARCPFIKCTS